MRKYILRLSVVLFTLFFYNINAQELIFKVDGKLINGNITEAVVVYLGEINYLQMRAEADGKIVYLYCKMSAINGELPAQLKFREHNLEKGETPDSEIIWVPEGPDKPQWNSINGETIVTQHNPENKTISGTFEFVVEKAQYSSKANAKKPSAEITNGIFSNIQYRVEENKEG